MSAITAKASRKMKKYAVLTREPRCFLGSFDFSWEQRKLGDISEIKTGPFGSTLHADDYVSDGTPIITTEHIKTGALPRSKNGLPQVSDSDYKRLTAYTLDDGDIVFSRVGSVDINALITPFQSNWLFSGRVLRVRPQTDISSKFLHTRLETESIKTDIRTRAVGQTMPSINTEILKITPLVLPSSAAEQEQIGSYFAALDNLITLHQRKCANLCSPSQVVFSLLFVTSTFSWEQRKLGDIASDMVAGGDIDKDLILAEGQYPVIANALTGDGIVGYYDKEYRVNAPAVTVTGRGDVGHAKARLVNFTPVVRLLSVKSEHDVFFLENAINTLKIVIESTGVPQLTVPQLAKYEVAFPRQLDEEEHIGAFFKQLDHLITLHQRECISFTGRADRLILTANKKRTTSSWEQRKLGELALFNPKDELPQTFEYVDLESVVGTEMLSHRTEVKSSAPSRAQRLAHTGDLFYQTVRPYQKNNYLFEKPDNNYVFSTGYAQMRPYVDGYFLLSLVQSERFVKVVLDNCTGTSYPAINANDLAEIEVAAPSDESEARKIGTIFRSIDNLITLHQRKPFLMKWRTSDANRNQTNRLVL